MKLKLKTKDFLDYYNNLDISKEYIILEGEPPEHRTSSQNSALHLFFTMLADALNDAGLDQRKVLKENVQIPWDCESVKDCLWRPIQKSILKEESTTKLKRYGDIDKIHAVLMRHLGEKFGVEYISIPSMKIKQKIDYPNYNSAEGTAFD